MVSKFRKDTDDLFAVVTHEALAKELRRSVASVRQARKDEDNRSYREPPPNWEPAVLRLAEKQAAHFLKLVKRLRST